MDNFLFKNFKRRLSKSCSSHTLIEEKSDDIRTTSVLTKSIAGAPCISFDTPKALAKMNEPLKGLYTTDSGEVKLVSPFGDFCAYEGGGGSGGCIITGPYESLLYTTDLSEGDSFESTEATDEQKERDAKDPNTGKKGKNYKHGDVLWVKRPNLPWIPAYFIDLELINDKKTKSIMKFFGASPPSKKMIADKATAIECSLKPDEKLYFFLILNKKKHWMWLPDNKVRSFCWENDELFLDKLLYFKDKYFDEVLKAYKGTREYDESLLKNENILKK